MSRKFGPSRGELWVRLWVGIGGLCLLAVALWVRGIPSGPALVEVVGLAGLVFGGTVLWAGWRLWKRDHP
jgi:hypothetical protein